jgi:hypothetical protein
MMVRPPCGVYVPMKLPSATSTRAFLALAGATCQIIPPQYILYGTVAELTVDEEHTPTDKVHPNLNQAAGPTASISVRKGMFSCVNPSGVRANVPQHDASVRCTWASQHFCSPLSREAHLTVDAAVVESAYT